MTDVCSHCHNHFEHLGANLIFKTIESTSDPLFHFFSILINGEAVPAPTLTCKGFSHAKNRSHLAVSPKQKHSWGKSTNEVNNFGTSTLEHKTG